MSICSAASVALVKARFTVLPSGRTAGFLEYNRPLQCSGVCVEGGRAGWQDRVGRPQARATSVMVRAESMKALPERCPHPREFAVVGGPRWHGEDRVGSGFPLFEWRARRDSRNRGSCGWRFGLAWHGLRADGIGLRHAGVSSGEATFLRGYEDDWVNDGRLHRRGCRNERPPGEGWRFCFTSRRTCCRRGCTGCWRRSWRRTRRG